MIGGAVGVGIGGGRIIIDRKEWSGKGLRSNGGFSFFSRVRGFLLFERFNDA